MRAVAVLLLSAAAVLAPGCLHGPTPAASAAAAQPAPTAVHSAPLTLAQTGCESITWSVPVPASTLQPYLPAGFEPRPAEGQPGLDGLATLTFRTVECARGLDEPMGLRSVQTGQVSTAVVPPAELRDDRFGARYSFGWDLLVAPDAWREKAAAWTLPVHDGGSLVGPGTQGWRGELAMDQVGTFSLTGRTFTSNAVPDHEDRLITKGAQGFALWDTKATKATSASGIGLWDVSPGSWVAKLLGSTQGTATFEYATFDQPDGSVHWPGQSISPVQPGQGFH